MLYVALAVPVVLPGNTELIEIRNQLGTDAILSRYYLEEELD